ncbi:hypothetical protein [Marinimicrobium alkaliphilum]|uniref:hypothetical protein n=1 Tax=Marinimicrobium alkaliphilum TaxID=2202654 RepID=UPI0013002A6F|nr:hypothetical protein [Marinimicrobium alkaliphilum]
MNLNGRVDLLSLQDELVRALELLEGHSGVGEQNKNVHFEVRSLIDASSLLHRCETVALRSKSIGKPKLRVIRHLACSGGTLVSKCLSAMPNVYLLSELNPRTLLHMSGDTPKFTPSDVVTQARYSGVPEVESLSGKIFLESVKLASHHVDQIGGYLVVRSHSHSDYCVDDVKGCSVSEVLRDDFDLSVVTTVRNPIDSFMGLRKNNWLHFCPKTFDEYCKRYEKFIDDQDDSSIFSYEKFIHSPQEVMLGVCEALSLPFDDSFEDTFGAFRVSGDSGRKGDLISERKREVVSDELEKELCRSEGYRRLMKKMANLEI